MKSLHSSANGSASASAMASVGAAVHEAADVIRARSQELERGAEAERARAWLAACTHGARRSVTKGGAVARARLLPALRRAGKERTGTAGAAGAAGLAAGILAVLLLRRRKG
ncbi:hypothetical protein OG455_37240 [Kitasatospora sp. NBC_01287]|uniref:hypothetical protein n=1 Tax=Kitasatospora sp. NBC_01287 TaxID=2903573 RepID=UPI0022526497|nr:hypothetical protein [Kitasatospora sp. NBC_01287]MCX4751086.1 hypothetical protein [Kitasatospora sp. NBC_01287]